MDDELEVRMLCQTANRTDLVDALDRKRMNISVVGSSLGRLCRYSVQHAIKPAATLKRALQLLEFYDRAIADGTVLRWQPKGTRLEDAPSLAIEWIKSQPR